MAIVLNLIAPFQKIDLYAISASLYWRSNDLMQLSYVDFHDLVVDSVEFGRLENNKKWLRWGVNWYTQLFGDSVAASLAHKEWPFAAGLTEEEYIKFEGELYCFATEMDTLLYEDVFKTTYEAVVKEEKQAYLDAIYNNNFEALTNALVAERGEINSAPARTIYNCMVTQEYQINE